MKLSDIIIREFRSLPGGYNPIVHDPVIERIIKAVSPAMKKREPRLKDEADLSEHVRQRVLGVIQEISLSNRHLSPEDAVAAMGIGVSIAFIHMCEALYGRDSYKAASQILELSYKTIDKGEINGLEHHGSDSERRTGSDRKEP